MKKVLLTLIVALGLCGSIYAQGYESHWPGFDYHAFEMHGMLVAGIQIDGETITVEDARWDALEVAFFVNDVCRGNENYLTDDYVLEYGDPFPILDGASIFYDNTGEEVVVKMYDHMNGIEYDNCIVTLEGDPFTIIASDDNDQGYFDPENPVMLNFVSSTPAQSFIKYIEGVGYENWNSDNNGGYYFIASPLAGVTNPADVENMIDAEGNYDLYAFDQAQDWEWINYLDQNDGGFNLVNGKGYLYALPYGDTLTFTGTPVDGNSMTIDLDYVEGVEFAGWNLVGNPFTVDAYLDKDFYVLNDDRNEVVAAPEGQYTIPAMEGAFVCATEAGQTVTIDYTPSYGKSASFALNLSQNRGVIDRAVVKFGEGNLPKFQLNPNHTKVYIPMNGKDYAVVSSEGVGEMPVNFKAEKSGIYTLTLSSDNVNFAYLHLIDNMTGNDVNLLETPSYSFNAQTTDYASRFRLVFATGTSVDGDSFGFVNGSGNFCIYGIDGEATVQVVDVLGHVLSSETFSGSYEKNLNVATGTYMIRLIQGNDVKVQKMVVK